jgi:hypothetical protein
MDIRYPLGRGPDCNVPAESVRDEAPEPARPGKVPPAMAHRPRRGAPSVVVKSLGYDANVSLYLIPSGFDETRMGR